jgi:hypothetical protein
LFVSNIYRVAADPVAYVLSLNLHRRHLSPTQLDLVAAKAREMFDDQAKERMRNGGKAAGKGRPKQGMENFPHPNGTARDKAAELVGVSGKSVGFASRVLRQGTPKLVEAVEKDQSAEARWFGLPPMPAVHRPRRRQVSPTRSKVASRCLTRAGAAVVVVAMYLT